MLLFMKYVFVFLLVCEMISNYVNFCFIRIYWFLCSDVVFLVKVLVEIFLYFMVYKNSLFVCRLFFGYLLLIILIGFLILVEY